MRRHRQDSTGLVSRSLRTALVRASKIESLENRILFANRIWDGGGSDGNWTNPINWQQNVAPVAGDSLFFPAGVSNRNTNNDFIVDTAFASIQFDGLTSYSASGNRIALGAGGLTVLGSATHTFNAPIAIANVGASVSVSDLATLNMSGPFTGAGALNKNATGLLTLTGDSPAFTGAINVNGGSLRVTTPLGLGDVNGQTFVVDFASIILASSATGIGETAFLSGTGDGNIGALQVEGSATWAGGIEITRTGTVVNVVTGDFTLSGAATSGATSASFVKQGPGRMILAGAAFEGIDTTIAAGTLQLAGANPVLGDTIVSNGATLEITGNRTATVDSLSITGAGSGAGVILNVSGNNTITGPVSLAGSATIGSTAGTLTLRGNIDTTPASPARNLTVSGAGSIVIGGSGTGAITGNGAINKLSTGVLTLSGSGASTFTGAVNVSTGNLVAAKASALGATSAGTVVSSGAGLKLSGGVTLAAEPLTINGNGVGNTGALGNVTGNNTFAGNITLGSAARIASDAGLLLVTGNIDTTNNAQLLSVSGAGNVEFGGAGVLSGAGGLNKEGTGKLTLSGTGLNSFTGVTKAFNGIIELRKNSALGSTVGNTVTQGPGTVQTASTFTIGQIGFGVSIAEPIVINGSGFGSLGALNNASGFNLWSGPVNVPNPASIGSQSNTLLISGNITGTQAISKFGSGGIALSGNNSGFTGLISVNAGSLNARSSTALGGTAQPTNVTSGATLSLGTPTTVGNIGGGVTITGETLNLQGGATLASNILVSFASTWAGPVVLNGTTSRTISAVTPLNISGVISGSAPINKTGNGTLTISNGANTFTGATTLSAGTLNVTGVFNSDIQANNTSSIIGTGTIRSLIANTGSKVNPGTVGTAGRLTATGNITLFTGSIFTVDLAGTASGQFDQLRTTGGNIVLKAGPTLAVNLLFTSSVKDVFKILDNTGAGTTGSSFANPTVVVNNQSFSTSIVGNDLLLTHDNTQSAFGNRTITSPINEGQAATLSGTIVDPDPLDSFFLDINWGDGAIEHYFFGPSDPRDLTLTHLYKDNAFGTAQSTYPVGLTWRDQNNGSRSDTLSVVVKNVGPIISAGGNATINRNTAFTRAGNYFDPGNDSVAGLVNFGDGSGWIGLTLQNGHFTLQHSFASTGSFEIKLYFKDSDGAITNSSFVLTVV